MIEGQVKKPNSSIMYVWQGINGVMALFFFLAALANLNDADWYIWFPIYIIPSVLAFPLLFKPTLAETRFWTISSIVHFTTCCAYSLYQIVILIEVIETRFWTMSSIVHFTICCAYSLYQIVILIEVIGNRVQNPLQYEVGREMGGLFIIIAWLGISRFTNIARPNEKISNQKMMSALLLMTVTLTILPLFVWSLCFVSDWHTRLGHCSGMF